MKSRTLLYVTLLTILVSMLVTACASGERFYVTNYSDIEFNSETSYETLELEVSTGMSSNKLNVEMNLGVGQLVFRLSSPDGQIQWEEAFTAPAKYQHKFDLDATPGIWKLAIELGDATGDYNIDWKTDFNR